MRKISNKQLMLDGACYSGLKYYINNNFELIYRYIK